MQREIGVKKTAPGLQLKILVKRKANSIWCISTCMLTVLLGWQYCILLKILSDDFGMLLFIKSWHLISTSLIAASAASDCVERCRFNHLLCALHWGREPKWIASCGGCDQQPISAQRVP